MSTYSGSSTNYLTQSRFTSSMSVYYIGYTRTMNNVSPAVTYTTDAAFIMTFDVALTCITFTDTSSVQEDLTRDTTVTLNGNPYFFSITPTVSNLALVSFGNFVLTISDLTLTSA
jgi:hypothetical protein